MIRNLPDRFAIAALGKFEFGEAEAQSDPLLSECPVFTAAIEELLANRKDIVHGFRGTGKSAIVKLLVDRKLEFQHDEQQVPVLLCLDDEFDYRAIREFIYERTEGERSRKMSCRIVWELLIVYRALQTVRDHFGDSDSTIREYIADIDVMLGVTERRPKLMQIILSHKKKVGVKLDANLPSVVDMYTALEPSPEAVSEQGNAGVLRIVEYKRYLNDFLHDRKAILYVLFDRLDDFVVHEDYPTQKLLLQELLATQADYRSKCGRIRLKAFLRTDLFRKLDLSELGPDKVEARCIELAWSDSELKELLAKRVAHSIMRVLSLSTLEVRVEAVRVVLRREELSQLKSATLSLSRFNVLSRKHWKKLMWLVAVHLRMDKAAQYGREQNSSDLVNEAIIESVFPREVCSLGGPHAGKDIDLFDFLESHLQFAHGQATPRVVLMFANRCLDSAKEYYKRNRDISSVVRNANGGFPLFPRACLERAYGVLREEAWRVQFQWAARWKPLVAEVQRFAEVNPAGFSFGEFCGASGAEEGEVRQFLAFVRHTGLIRCTNQHARHEQRRYEIPILFLRTRAPRMAG